MKTPYQIAVGIAKLLTVDAIIRSIEKFGEDYAAARYAQCELCHACLLKGELVPSATTVKCCECPFYSRMFDGAQDSCVKYMETIFGSSGLTGWSPECCELFYEIFCVALMIKGE